MTLTPVFLLLFGLVSQQRTLIQPPNAGAASAAPSAATAPVSCQSELRWLNSDMKFYSLGNTFQVSLFSAVGVGCTPAEVRVTAVYLDNDENVVCSGVVEGAAQMDQNTQSVILEFKPVTTLEFVRWRNGLRPPQPIAKRLVCIGPDQLTEVPRLETDRAASLRIFVSLLPRGGAVSTVEIKVDPRLINR